MKIFWAHDPFKKNSDLDQLGKKIIEKISSGTKDSVTAIYIASFLEADLSYAFNVAEKDRYSTFPKNQLKEALKKLKLDHFKTEIIPARTLSLTKIIKEFVNYTKNKKADLVVIPSNNQKALPRLVFGSFSEALVHASESDLLIYHQQTKFNPKEKMSILYAHDFSKKGDRGLERLLQYAKKWDAQITILHTPLYDPKNSMEKNKMLVEKRVTQLATFLDEQKIEHEIIVSKEMKIISKILLSTAKKKHSTLIAITAQTSKLAALLGGSVTRQVLRETKIPTLVLKIK